MVKYHMMYDEIENEAILAVREIIKSGLFKKETSRETKEELIQKLHEKLCGIYNLPIIPIKFDKITYGMGNYNVERNEITINKPSLTTFAHEFFHMKAFKKGEKNSERLARGWSHSLYFLAAPKLFENAVTKGLLVFQHSMNEQVEVPEENQNDFQDEEEEE